MKSGYFHFGKYHSYSQKGRDPMRVAGYARVSTQEQKLHGVSVAAQEQALADWAAEHGH